MLQQRGDRSFSPLAELLTERTAPELAYLENKFAAMISYGLTAKLLAEVLPTGGDINVAGVYRNLQRVAERMEAELGEEKWQFIDGCQRDWDALPPPGPPLTVGLDGGYIHAKDQKSRGEGWFEVIAGKSMPEEGAAKCFAYVQTYDTKPKRRLFELMKSQGLQANQQVTFLSDGADDVRELPLYLSLYTWLSLVHQARGNARHTKPESRRVERGNEPRGHPLSAGWRWYHSQATRGRGAGTFSNTLWNGIPFER
jgi:hypothetical protein